MSSQHDKERDAVARVIRHHFAERKTAIHGRNYKPSSRHDKFTMWQAAADQCIAVGANPQDYVAAMFEFCPMKMGPFANQIAGKAALKWWKKYTSSRSSYDEDAADRDTYVSNMSDEVSPAAKQDLMQELSMSFQLFRDLTGENYSPLNPANKVFLSQVARPFTTLSRVLLGFPDEAVMSRFGEEAQQILINRPDKFRAAKALGFPVDQIVTWRNKNKMET